MAEHASTNKTPQTGSTIDLGDERYRISLIKGDQRWSFRWEPGSEAALIDAVAALVRNPDADLDRFDAVIVCKHITQPFVTASRRGNSCAPPKAIDPPHEN